MVSLKERLSLDWLKEAQSQRASGAVEFGTTRKVGGGNLSPHLEDAVLAYGNRLLRALREEPTKTARLHALVTRLGLSLPDALPVVGYLIERDHLKKLEDDPLGDYKLYLTDQGEKLIS